MIETALADTWLYQTLTSDTVLAPLIGTRVCGDLAPETTAYPYVILQLLAANDVAVTNATRIAVECVYLVKAVAETESYNGTLATIAGRIDLRLHRASAELTGGRIIACTRERPFRMAESRFGMSFRHLGGQFRLLIQATS